MRSTWLACGFLLVTSALAAQAPEHRWRLQIGTALEAFGGASADTSTIAGTEVEVRPASRLAFAAGLHRRWGAWEAGVELGYGSGALRAVTDELQLDDRIADVTRYRAALLLGRRLAHLGNATLTLLGGPAVDHWELGGYGGRTTFAVQAGLALRFPLGARVEVEHRVFGGLGGSPFRRETLPPEAEIRSLRTLGVGAGLRIGL
ncbi:MAG: hypothetical protein IPI38_05470 [Gemmatimonadetes bacterium]|nr:hypothetical protein [Gemmatimonadota bacterium]MBK7349286.1 hypothetical protein [Gemmatimonadota bacterium]MBK7714853.1 hypothetical protein [Gemmatimonadota bacterium]MBK7783914.1 hypothetical protein [Gemmatimonadota bacterium]MBK9068039.1 hypothetical protein [Gemmatimonadota bacterium]